MTVPKGSTSVLRLWALPSSETGELVGLESKGTSLILTSLSSPKRQSLPTAGPESCLLGMPTHRILLSQVLSGPLMETLWVSPSPSEILKASPQGSLTATITVWLLAVQPH